MRALCELPYCAIGMSSSFCNTHGMLATHSCSSCCASTWQVKRWMSSSHCSASSTERQAGVMNSNNDSEKSVVMLGCFNAEPSATGWGVCASLPSGVTRKLSFSMPRRMSLRLRVNAPFCSACNRLAKPLSCAMISMLIGDGCHVVCVCVCVCVCLGRGCVFVIELHGPFFGKTCVLNQRVATGVQRTL